ncbi:MAG TPA: site-specific DNA-methyltransferase, partial [Candidatus Atribacteria bacterium]|nr:site-specific DNA-methyltransferase [Candidatus Atribacteria bacterium]
WPYKDCILEGGQEKTDEKRKEIFHNEILAPDEIDRLLDPKVFTNFKRINKDGEHPLDGFRRDAELNRKRGLPEDTITDNLIIKGNNLLVLHSLKKRFARRIKLIYIDPPYNTGNDEFNYNDNFNHSTWLTFMKNRLEVARELLREDGVIFVQIDDREHAYLKVLMDEVFGKNNFINHIAVKVKSSAGFKTVNKGVMEVSEYILIYAKDNSKCILKKIYRTTGYDPNYRYVIENPTDPIENWKFTTIDEKIRPEVDKLKHLSLDRKILNMIIHALRAEYAIKNPNKAFRYTAINDDAGKETVKSRDLSKTNDKVYEVKTEKGDIRYVHRGNQITFYLTKLKEIDGKLQPSEQVTNIWTDIPWEGIANEGYVKLKKGKKPEILLKKILDISTEKGDIVLDFFMGTGTTCSVAHKMGRQYIGVEQLDYGENSAVVRLKNVINGDQSGISKAVGWKGGGDFVYCELMELNEKFIHKIQKAKDTKELLQIWEEMNEHAFLSYKIEPKDIDDNIEEFKELSFKDQKRFLIEILDKNNLYVNYSEIDDKQYNVSEEDNKLNNMFYKR